MQKTDTNKLQYTGQESEQTASANRTVVPALLFDYRLHLAFLILITCALFGRTLTGYFLADDFGEVKYVSRIVGGDLSLLWSNFTGNYMQIPSMSVWRPWLLITLVFDYLLWQGNATGYYLTNLIYFAGDVILLYLITRKLTASWSEGRSTLAALTGSILFAVSPLHCESISWVVGRVDIACCFYYLVSLLLMLYSRSKSSKFLIAGAVISYWLGLWTKEMAIGLPVLLTAFAFFFPRQECQRLMERVRSAFSFAAPIWISTLVYFPLRYLALGTFTGGYTGGLGDSQTAAALQRWLDPDTIHRLFFPFTQSIYAQDHFYIKLLAGCYLIYLAALGMRILKGDLSLKWFAFMSVWILTALAPIYRLWGLGYNLEGSRFVFFLTVPLSLTLPLLLLSPAERGNSSGKLTRRIITTGLIALCGASAVLYKTAYATNLQWVHAGKEVKALSRNCQELAEKLGPGEKAAILGVPKGKGGTHMILNGYTFSMMLSPPFTSSPVFDRFITYDPVMFGPPQYINSDRFKSAAADPDVRSILLWEGPRQGFRQLEIDKSGPASPPLIPIASEGSNWQTFSLGASSRSTDFIHLQKLKDGEGLLLKGFNINPLDIDFLSFDVRGYKHPSIVKVFWGSAIDRAGSGPADETRTSVASAKIAPGDSYTRVRVRLSRFWRWYAAEKVDKLFLQLPPGENIELKNIELRSSDSLVPHMRVPELKPSPEGIYSLSGNNDLLLSLDGRRVTGADSIQVELSYPNYFFFNVEDKEKTGIVAKKLSLNELRGTLKLPEEALAESGFYELRARCLDSSGKPAGEYTDPVTINKP